MKKILFLALFSIFIIGCSSEEPKPEHKMDKEKIEESFKELEKSK